MRTGEGREVGNDFSDVGWASCEGLKQHAPVVELIVDGRGQADAATGAFQRGIETREETQAAGKHGCDASQVAAEDLPV